MQRNDKMSDVPAGLVAHVPQVQVVTETVEITQLQTVEKTRRSQSSMLKLALARIL